MSITVATPAMANERHARRFAPGPIVTSIDDYREQPLVEEELHGVAGARVLLPDYGLIAHDFAPRFGDASHGIDDETRARIDAWLLEHAAVISQAQAAQSVTNSDIPLLPQRRRAYRPPCYGRAAVVPVRDDRFIDVKGIGVAPGATPSFERHSDGLLTMNIAIREMLFEMLSEAALFHAGSFCGVVPSYGVIDLGFEVIDSNGRREPACAVARRAHTRPRTQWGNENPGLAIARMLRDILLVLRRYGIDSITKPYIFEEREGALVLSTYGRKWTFEGDEARRVAALVGYRGGRWIVDALNLQFTTGMHDDPPRPQLFDFGAFCARQTFAAPLFVPTVARYVSLIGEVTMPDDPRFTRACSERHAPAATNHIARTLTTAYTRGKCSGAEVWQRLVAFVYEAIGIMED